MKYGNLIKTWQKFLKLNKFQIYVLEEKPSVLKRFWCGNENWDGDKRMKEFKKPFVNADTIYDLNKKLIIIRLNKNLAREEIEGNIIHELLHVKIELDEEWVVQQLASYLINMSHRKKKELSRSD